MKDYMSEKDKKEEKINFDSIRKVFSTWVRRLEEEGLEWREEDWVHWGIDITDAIIDLYSYLKPIGVLKNGLSELLYIPKDQDQDQDQDQEEEDIDKGNNSNTLYS